MNRRFFQFPLCALSVPSSERARLNNIISFCCLEVGKQQWQKFSQIEVDLRRQQQSDQIHCICEIDLANDAHQYALAGARRADSCRARDERGRYVYRQPAEWARKRICPICSVAAASRQHQTAHRFLHL